MKKYFIDIQHDSLRHKKILFSIVLIIVFFLNGTVMAQNQMTDIRLPVNINLSYKKTNDIKSIKVKVTQINDNKNAPVMGPIVNLYLNKIMKHNEQTGLGWIGNYNLNRNGEAVFELSNGLKNITRGKAEFIFICRMLSDQQYENKEETITIKDANLIVRFSEKDSKKYVVAKLTEWKDTLTELPVPGVDLKLFIKSNLHLLSMKNEQQFTDKNGEVYAELPIEASEDDRIIAKIENNENFGTIETTQEIPGIMLSSVSNTSSTLIAIGAFLLICVGSVIFYFSRSKKAELKQ